MRLLQCGASLGAKGQLEIYSPIGSRMFGFALGTLSSTDTSFFTMAKIGYRITDRISFGPEGMAQGNSQQSGERGGGPSGPGASGLHDRAGLRLRF